MRTGLPSAEPTSDSYAWDHLDWVWNEEHILRALTEEAESHLVVAGTAPHQGKFYPHFHHVILLSAPTPVILEHLDRRRGDAYGATPRSRARILEHIETVEPRIRAGADMEIDTSRPLAEVLGQIVGILEGDGQGGGTGGGRGSGRGDGRGDGR